MFIPPKFRQDDLQEIITFIQNHSLATLVGINEQQTVVAHIPMIIHTQLNGERVLLGHCFKNNPIVSAMSQPQQWLAIFQHEGHYISPNWYPNKAITHKEVPTWNYQAVHIRGKLNILDDAEAVLSAQTHYWENRLPNHSPWQLQDAPSDFLQGMYRALTCFEIQIEEIQAQFKLSQNKDDKTRQNVCQQLRYINTEQATQMAELIERYAAKG